MVQWFRLVIVALVIATASAVHAAPLWQDTVSDDGRGDGQANDVVASDDAVFVSGFVADVRSEPLLRAYDPASGHLLWEDRLDDVDAAELGRLALLDGRIFATAFASRGAATTGIDWVVRAYDASTGAVLWTDDLDRGPQDWARRIAAAGQRVFVAGTLGDAALGQVLAVRAYDAATGALAWEDQSRPVADAEFVPSVAASPERVFVSGVVDGTGRVLAYDAASGDVVWTRELAGPTVPDQLALAAGRVVVAARDGETLHVHAYDASTGDLLWQRDEPPAGDVAHPLATAQIQLAATADTVHASVHRGGTVAALHAYAAADGSPLWTRTTDVARDLTVDGGRLYAASGLGSFLARAFDAGSGQSIWSSPGRSDASALAIAVRGPLVFVVGAAGDRFGTFYVEAYDTRTRSLRTIGRYAPRLPTRR